MMLFYMQFKLSDNTMVIINIIKGIPIDVKLYKKQ